MHRNFNICSKSVLYLFKMTYWFRIIWFDIILEIFSLIFIQRFDFVINPGLISVINGNYLIRNKVTHDVENSFCKNGSFFFSTLIWECFIPVKSLNGLRNHISLCRFIMANMFFIQGRKKKSLNQTLRKLFGDNSYNEVKNEFLSQ